MSDQATQEMCIGNCYDVMRSMDAESVTAVVTDPPYALGFMAKDWDLEIPGAVYWREALRVAKPGANLFSFGGARSHHRLMCAIEDAGWQLRDTLCWLYGSGFPKSLNISKAIDKSKGLLQNEGMAFNVAGMDYGRDVYGDRPPVKGYVPPEPQSELAKRWVGYGTALKPAWEPIVMAMKPLDGTNAQNALRHGVAGINVDGGRVGSEGATTRSHQAPYGLNGWRTGHSVEVLSTGRWPANVALDEEAGALLDEQSESKMHGAGYAKEHNTQRGDGVATSFGGGGSLTNGGRFGDTGGASRFFYCAKANGEDRGGISNVHPTVKPVSLMRWLVRMVRMPAGYETVVLDPFAGSGSTGVACALEDVSFIGIERESYHARVAERRIREAV